MVATLQSFVSSANLLLDTKPSFSLRDEARNTERNHDWSGSDLKLRHKKVVFVSAGKLHGDMPFESETSDLQRDQIPEIPANVELRKELFLRGEGDVAAATANVAQLCIADKGSFLTPKERVDFPRDRLDEDFKYSTPNQATDCAQNLAPKFLMQREPASPCHQRQSSPTSSDSSEDVVVFRGRRVRHSRPGIDQTRVQPTENLPLSVQRLSKVRAESSLANSGAEAVPIGKPCTSPAESCLSDTTRKADHTAKNGRRRRRKRGRGGTSSQLQALSTEDSDDQALADYVENLRENSEEITSMAFNLPAPYSDDCEPVDTISDRVAPDSEPVSMFEDTQYHIQQIISKRIRPTGPQYLAVCQDSLVSRARWLPASVLTQAEELLLIQAFEESWGLASGKESGSEWENFENSSSADEDEDGLHSIEDGEPDIFGDDALMRHVNQMTDEQIAHALAKQDDLGFSTNEVLLFNEASFNQENYEQSKPRPSFTISDTPTRGLKMKKKKEGFPSASLMADILEQDPYNGFDVMDFDRPSLRSKKKNSRPLLPGFDLSDDEVELHLQNTWEIDREKKKLRKQHRQELREHGLLGRQNKFKPDFRVKYSSGMTSMDVLIELKQFWVSEHSRYNMRSFRDNLVLTDCSYAFPPMDKKDRKVLHELASKLAMTSKSRGAGKKRFPILNKTSRTPDFDDPLFSRLERVIGRRAGGFGASAYSSGSTIVSYRNGEVVGGTAPEIGKENRGRAMLEKMGWTTGTALGAVHNKGILTPITHTFKATKQGLGQ